jgi:signal transduction histidine kinase
MDSKIQLFIVAQILGTSTIYLAAMFILKRTNKLGTAFFAAGLIFVISLIAILFRKQIGESVARTINHSLSLSYILIMTTILTLTINERKKLKCKSTVIMPMIILLCYVLVSTTMNELSSLIILSIMICSTQLYASKIAYSGYKLLSSRGMLLISITSAFSCLGQLLRLEELIFESGKFMFSQFTWKTNFLMVTGLISILGVNIGYLGFLIEDSERKTLLSEQMKEKLRIEKEEIEKLLKENEGMIIRASRLSSLNKISIYTAAIIHEITQPLQALKLAIVNLKILLGERNFADVEKNIEQINMINNKIQDIVLVLRGIITKGKADVEIISAQEIILRSLNIITGECQRRGIIFEADIEHEEILIEINPTLLQRIIFNICANAIEALSAVTNEKKLLIVRSYRDLELSSLFIEILDNSTGLNDPLEISLNLETIADTAKEDGMGLGLAFSSGIIKGWHGDLCVSTIEINGNKFTRFSIRLPLKVGAIEL